MRNRALLFVAIAAIFVIFFIFPSGQEPTVVEDNALSSAPDPTLRSIASGQLSGLIQDNGSYAWKNIPYAQPPVGELRWKLPQPAQPWSGVYSAINTIQPCTQFASGLTDGIADPDGDGIVGSEDCLYLSVYAPADASPEHPLPVMYWIFGGGNNSGYAGDYNGGTLAEQEEVVVVTVNYRLGALGWFLHPAVFEPNAMGAAAGGNWSTVDTIRGLEWVRDNIAAFGGDPDNVTIFGESAGGSNVMSLMTSPMAAGLFHRAVVESGGISTESMASGMNYMDDEDAPGHFHSSREIINKILIRDGRAADRDAAKQLQRSMSNQEIHDLLYAQDAASFLRLYNPEGARNYPAPKKFTDGVVFVTDPPLQQLASGNYNRVPIILGTNRDERRIYMYRTPYWAETIQNNPDEYVRVTKYISDMRKLSGVDNLAHLMSPAQENSVYAFRFDWDEQGTTASGVDLSIAVGAAHSTEMAFVFGDWNIGFIRGGDLYDPATVPGRNKLSNAMMTYWANFAYTGNPNRGRNGDLPQWQAWQNGEDKPKMIILDAEDDGGIRMSSDEMTLASLKAGFLAEQFDVPDNRCLTYRDTFGGNGFDRDEYLGLGCSADSIPAGSGNSD